MCAVYFRTYYLHLLTGLFELIHSGRVFFTFHGYLHLSKAKDGHYDFGGVITAWHMETEK